MASISREYVDSQRERIQISDNISFLNKYTKPNKELKDCGLFHGCKIYLETDDQIVYQFFLKNFSEAMAKHYGVVKTDEELDKKLDILPNTL